MRDLTSSGHWFPPGNDTAFAELDNAGVVKAQKQIALLKKWNTWLLEWALLIKDQNFASEEDLLSHFKCSFLNIIFDSVGPWICWGWLHVVLSVDLCWGSDFDLFMNYLYFCESIFSFLEFHVCYCSGNLNSNVNTQSRFLFDTHG